MRYNLDPSRNTVDGYTDASLNSVSIDPLALWTTLRPLRNECTSTYVNTLSNNELTGSWSRTQGTWTAPINQYLITIGALKAWEDVGTIAAVSNLLFLNSNTIIQYTSSTNKPIRANGIANANVSETYIGTEIVNQDILRMNSEVKEDGSGNWFAGWDLSGVQRGFGPPSIGTGATNPSNTFLEWQTSEITNAFDITNDKSRNGGYYCGTSLNNIKIKNVNLTDYRDVSYNTNQKGYKVTIYQELKASVADSFSNNRFPSASGGQYKLFNPATIPTQDITFDFANATFVINDGYDGTAVYQGSGRTNNFKFGQGVSQNPTPNFFGLPLIYPSTNVVSMSMTFSQFDKTWWPNDDSNVVDYLRFYVKGGSSPLPSVYHSTKPSGNYIQWGGTNTTKEYPWDEASNVTGSFPDLPSNGISSLTGNFDFNNGGSASFTNNKYSRDLFNHETYDMSANYKPNNPFFYVDCQYDNNILRSNRGRNNLEAGDRRTIGESYTSAGIHQYKNRFEGKGVGPDGRYLLFWDNTLNTSVTFQKVGDTGASPFNNYPYVAAGTTNDYTTAFDHADKLSNGTTASNGGDRQVIWAKNGFKPGGQTVSSTTNPYIDYSGNYWFGNHTSGFTQDYSNLNTIGEIMDPSSVEYINPNDGGKFSWWEDTNSSFASSFIWDSSMRFKFLVLKVPTLVGAVPAGGYRGFTFEIETNTNAYTIGTNYDHRMALPISDDTDLISGNLDTPVLWWCEVGNSGTHPSSLSYPGGVGKTGWKDCHKCFNVGYTTSQNAENGAGSMDQSIHIGTIAGSGANEKVKIHRIYGVTTGGGGAFDLYFRIGVANGANYDIKKVKLQFYEVSGTTYSKSTGTGNSKTFTFSS